MVSLLWQIKQQRLHLLLNLSSNLKNFVKHSMNTKGGQFTMLNNILYLQNQKRKFIYFSRFVSISIFVFINTISPNSHTVSLSLSLSISLPSNALISNANMQNKSHTSFPMNSIKRSIACWQKVSGTVLCMCIYLVTIISCIPVVKDKKFHVWICHNRIGNTNKT